MDHYNNIMTTQWPKAVSTEIKLQKRCVGVRSSDVRISKGSFTSRIAALNLQNFRKPDGGRSV